MKTLGIILLAATFMTSAFADCRIAFEGAPAAYFSRAGVHKKGFQLVELKDVKVGDYIDTYENYHQEGIRILGSNTGNLKVRYVQVIKRVTESGAVEIFAKQKKTKLFEEELDYDIVEAPAGVTFNTRIMNQLRVNDLPSCRKLNKL